MNPTIRLDIERKRTNIITECTSVSKQRRQQTFWYQTYNHVRVRASALPAETVPVCCICKIHFIRKEPLPVFCWGFNYTNLPQVLIIFTFFNLPGLNHSAAVRTETSSFGDGRTTTYNSKLVWSLVHNANTLWQTYRQRADNLMWIVVALVAVGWVCWVDYWRRQRL